MKIEQQPKFQPITITLETATEAEVFWQMVESIGKPGMPCGDARDMAIDLCNWMSMQGQLGGARE